MDQTILTPLIDRMITLGLLVAAAILAGILTWVFVYLLSVFLRLKKREQLSLEMVTLEVKLQKDNEIKIDAA